MKDYKTLSIKGSIILVYIILIFLIGIIIPLSRNFLEIDFFLLLFTSASFITMIFCLLRSSSQSNLENIIENAPLISGLLTNQGEKAKITNKKNMVYRFQSIRLENSPNIISLLMEGEKHDVKINHLEDSFQIDIYRKSQEENTAENRLNIVLEDQNLLCLHQIYFKKDEV